MANLQPKKEILDVVVVGCGAGGSVVAKELGESGIRVVVLEAGRRFNPQVDYPTDQPDFVMKALNVFRPKDPRQNHYTSSGAEAFSYNRVKGVGGSTLMYWAVTPRFHESDFRVRSEDGIADDWPISYSDLEPYYTRVEYELGVSGPEGADAGTFEPRRSRPFPTPPHELNCASRVIKRGTDKLGLHLIQSPLAIPTKNWNGRPACMRAGVCGLGCRIMAKSSMDVTYVPKAEATGRIEIRPGCQVSAITVGENGRARSVTYFDHAGQEHEILARAVVVAGNAIETPRLLLMSTSSVFPNGLANSSGLVGKYFTEHLAVSMAARFDERLDPWKGPMAGANLQDYYETDTRNNFARGWTTEVNNGGQWPLSMALSLPGWGAGYQAQMKRYFGHSIGLATVGDQLPDIRNQVTLDPVEKDHRGLPVPRLLNEPRENDLAMIKVIPRRLREILEAAGASDISEAIYTPGASSHYLGTCRMGTDPRSSVVNAWCRSHDVPNLYIGDSSVFVTGAAVNPTLTIAAIATRTAEGMVADFKHGEL